MVLGGVGWDRKEFPESNLHVYGKDDTKIIIYIYIYIYIAWEDVLEGREENQVI